MLRFTETDANGNPIPEAKLEKVIKDLARFDQNTVRALCASLIITHESHTWSDIYYNLKQEYSPLPGGDSGVGK